jgi:hypothetical protein
MDATTELTRFSGLQQLQAIFAGKTGYAVNNAGITGNTACVGRDRGDRMRCSSLTA